MELNPSSKSYSFSATQENPHILWHPKFHSRSHNCPPPVPNLILVTREFFLKICFYRSIYRIFSDLILNFLKFQRAKKKLACSVYYSTNSWRDNVLYEGSKREGLKK
jgi:hypothetical protein